MSNYSDYDDDFSTDLAAFDDEYKGTEAAEKKDFEPVPNGRYQAKIDKIYLSRAESSGDIMLKWELLIISGKYEGRRLFRNNMIATPDNLSWLKTDLKTIGIILEKTSDLPNRLEEFLDIVVQVSVRNRKEDDKEFMNVYLNKKLNIELPKEAQAGNAEGGKGALPF